ncbi:IS110 family transposase, partial [Psychroflexus sp. MES1-P1E]
LELIFVIDKNQNPYENDYHQKRVHHTNAEAPLQANL